MTTMLTEAELTELEALEKAATPGPWCMHPNGTSLWQGEQWTGNQLGTRQRHICNATGVTEQHVADLDLLVEMRNAIPSLLAAARELDGLKKEQALQLIEMTQLGPKLVAQELVPGLLAMIKFVLDGYDAPNYVETKCMDSDGQLYAVRFQRCEKESPHDLRLKAEADLRATRRELARARIQALTHLEDTYWWASGSKVLSEERRQKEARKAKLVAHWKRVFEAEAERTER